MLDILYNNCNNRFVSCLSRSCMWKSTSWTTRASRPWTWRSATTRPVSPKCCATTRRTWIRATGTGTRSCTWPCRGATRTRPTFCCATARPSGRWHPTRGTRPSTWSPVRRRTMGPTSPRLPWPPWPGLSSSPGSIPICPTIRDCEYKHLYYNTYIFITHDGFSRL